MTKQELLDYWNANLNTNASNAITGQKLNQGGVEIINAMAFEAGTTPFAPQYDNIQAHETVITADAPDWQRILALSYTIAAGTTTYEFKVSALYTFDDPHEPIHFRFSIDGGGEWNEFAIAAHDLPFVYIFPQLNSHVADTTLEFVFEAARAAGHASAMTIHEAALIVERKA